MTRPVPAPPKPPPPPKPPRPAPTPRPVPGPHRGLAAGLRRFGRAWWREYRVAYRWLMRRVPPWRLLASLAYLPESPARMAVDAVVPAAWGEGSRST